MVRSPVLALLFSLAGLLVPGGAAAQVSVSLLPPGVVAPGAPGPESPTLGGDAAHRSAWTGAGLRPPFEVAWQTEAEPIFAAVAAGGRVTYQTDDAIVAREAATGKELWRVPLGERPAELATDGGRVYVLAGTGVVALDSSTGALRWAIQAPSGAVGPVVAGGRLFLGSVTGGRVAAFQASTGQALWGTTVGIDRSRPAVSGDRLYVTGTCRAAALNATTGAVIWSTSTCTPGVGDGGTRTILTGQAVLSEDFALYAASDGTRISSGAAPGTVGGGVTFRSPLLTPAATALVASDAVTGATRWTFSQPRIPPGDPVTLRLRAAVVDDLVFQALDTGSNGLLLAALDVNTGAGRWSGFLPGAGTLSFGPTTAIAVSPGLLVIPSARGGLVALRNAPEGPLGLTATLPKNVVVARERTVVSGRLISNGHGLIGPRNVRLEADPFPFGDGYEAVATTIPGRTGRFSFPSRVNRNTRFRLVADSVTPPTVVYARPVLSARYGETSRRRVVQATLRIRSERGFNRAGTVAIYRLKRGTTVLQRVGTGRSSRSGTARFDVTIPADLTRSDKIVPCLRSASRRGFGPPNVLDRSCGSARIEVEAASAARLSRGAGAGTEIPMSLMWPASEDE